MTINMTIVKMETVFSLNLVKKILLQLLSVQINQLKLVTIKIICPNLEIMTFMYTIIVTIIFTANVT